MKNLMQAPLYFSLLLCLIFSFEVQAQAGKKCNAHSECGMKMGCYDAEPGENDDVEWPGTKEIGKSCSNANQCASGNCADVCKERNSEGSCTKTEKECAELRQCMYAPIGEVAPEGVLCEGSEEANLLSGIGKDQSPTKTTKDANGVCNGSYGHIVMIPEDIDVGSMDQNTCSVSINQESYKSFLNNFYALGAFEMMFQNPTTDKDCLDTTAKIRDQLATPLKNLHKAVGTAFKQDYFEGYLTPMEWLEKSGSEKDVNCGIVQQSMANLNATHYKTNLILLYGDGWKEKVYGPSASQAEGVKGLPSGLSGYVNLLPKAVSLSDEYFGIDWNHKADNFYSGDKCRNHGLARKKKRWWQRRYRFPDGLPKELVDFAGGTAEKSSASAGTVVLAIVTSGISLIFDHSTQFMFTDPVLPQDVPFKDYCGDGGGSGDHRRMCYLSDISWEMSRRNKPGLIYVFKDKAGSYFNDSVSTDKGKHLFGVLANDPEINMSLARMSFSNLFWYSGTDGNPTHPVSRRKVFFRLLENNLINLKNYMEKMTALRKQTMECFQQKSQELQQLCYDPGGTYKGGDYDGKGGKGEGDGSGGKGKAVKQKGAGGNTVSFGNLELPNFTNLLSSKGGAGTAGGSQLSGATVAADSLYNKAMSKRKREVQDALAKMKEADKKKNEQFNAGLAQMTSLSPAAMGAITGKADSAVAAIALPGNKADPKKDVKAPVVAVPKAANYNVPEPDYSAYGNKKNSSSSEDTTGMSSQDVDSMLTDAQTEKYNREDGDDLFMIISKTYVRQGYGRLLKKKAELETGKKEEKKETNSLDKIQDID